MANSKKEKLIICTTVPDTILYILKGQPQYLKSYFDVVIITGKSEKSKLISVREGVRVYEVPFKRNISLFFDLVTFIQMFFLMMRLKPKIVHSYTPKAGLIAMLSASLLLVPVRIHTFTGLIFPNQIGFKKILLIFMDRLICLCSTKVIPEGLGVKNDLVFYQITKKKLDIIGNGNISGVDTNYFSDSNLEYKDAVEKLGINSEFLLDKFVYSFIGRLNFDKGLNELFEAFIILPQHTCLLIAGDLDKDGNSISIELFNKLNNNGRIICLGFVEDVRLVLKITNVLVLPSYREGFPNVLLQSLSMRVPAIASNISGCNEILINNFNGWLIEPKNHIELAEKMYFTQKISDGDFEQIRNNSRASIIERYEQSCYRKELVSMYYKLI